jgi:hypothetical protein
MAGLLVLLALVVPDEVAALKPGTFLPGAFLRIPLEGIAGAALLIVLPPRARRVAAVLLGVGLGLLTILKILNMGFLAVLARRFDPVFDLPLLRDGYNFLTESFGRPAAIGILIGTVALVIAILVLLTLSVLRLARVAARHREPATRVVVATVAAWVVFAVLGTQLFPGAPVAANSAVALARDTARKVPAAVRDERAFAAASKVDAFRDTPGDALLTALRGKDVVFGVVESYGRSAVEDPRQAAIVDPALVAGTQQLAAAGFSAKTGFLTSSTFGGGSWLGHSSFQSGLWVNNQQRYRQLVTSDRLTLASAFKRANWQTVAVEPGNTGDWPEAAFYGYGHVYDVRNLGYRGPEFGWSNMPDQYTLAAFQRNVYSKPDRGPLMAEISLTSSHTPWAPIPRLVDWNDVGDGSIYGPIAKQGEKRATVWQDAARVRTEYARSIAYSVSSLVSWATTYGDDNLVLVLFGDHQAASIVSGQDASRDVPITIVAHDPAVLDRIAGWGWSDGMKPGPNAPVWPMSAFRDRFLTAFGPREGTAAPIH